MLHCATMRGADTHTQPCGQTGEPVDKQIPRTDIPFDASARLRSGTLRLCMGFLLVVFALTTIGCDSSGGGGEEVDKAEIQKVLDEYLPVLGQAYAERNPKLLEPWAVPKEQARIQLRIEELEARGQVYEPGFKSVTVENVSVWNYSNAFVTTVEVWDVKAFTLGTHMLVNESLDQRSRVKYQLKRKDEGWSILYRELEKTSDTQ